jgi:tetratricopeptide (TPR) repeat protein
VYYKKSLEEEHRLIAEIYIDLGRMYYDKKQLDEALDYYMRGLNMAQKILPDTHPEMGVFHAGIAVVYSQMGNIDKAQFHIEAIGNMDLMSVPSRNPPLSSYYEALYIFYSHKNSIHRTPTTQIPTIKQNQSQRTGVMFYRCPWCHLYVWIYKAFFFCKGFPCFRCLKQLLILRPSRVSVRLGQYLNYLSDYERFMGQREFQYLMARELRQQYLGSLADKNLIEPN